MGKLAETYGDGNKSLQGLLVQQNRNNIIVDPESLPAFTRLQRGVILQRQAVPLNASFSEVPCSSLLLHFSRSVFRSCIPCWWKTRARDIARFRFRYCHLQARFALEVFFEGVEGTPSLGRVEAGRDSEGALRIGDRLTLTHQPAAASGHGFAVMEWEAGAKSDMIADAVVATLMQVLSTEELQLVT